MSSCPGGSSVTSLPIRQQGKEPSTNVRQVAAACRASPGHGVCQTQATMLPRGDFKYTWWECKEQTDSIVQDRPCRRIVCRRVAPLHISMMSSIYMEKERVTIEVRQITGVEREASDGSVKLCGSGPVTSGRQPMVHLTGVMCPSQLCHPGSMLCS